MAANGIYADTSTDNFDTASQAPAAPASIAAPVAPVAPTAPASAGPQSAVGRHFANSSQSPLTGTAAAGNTIGKAIGAGIHALFGSTPSPALSNAPIQDTGSHNMYGVPMGTQGDTGTASQASLDAANANYGMKMAHGGRVPALVSPGEIRIHAKDVKKVAEGKKSPLAGEKIPGKPKVGGAKNDYANDTVLKTLNEGDIILPRSVTQAKHPHWAAKNFVEQIMAQKHRKKK